jgi:hypothetical protein
MSRLLPMLALAAATPAAAIAQAKPKARPSPPQTTAPRQPAAASAPSSAVPAGRAAGRVKAPESYYGESAPSTEATSFRAVPAGRYRMTARVIGPDDSAQPALVGVRTQLAGVAPTKPAPSAVATFPPYVLAGSEPGMGALTTFVLPAPR